MNGPKVTLCLNRPHYSSHNFLPGFVVGVGFCCFGFWFFLSTWFCFGGKLQGQRVDPGEQGNKWGWNACCEIYNESIKVKTKQTRNYCVLCSDLRINYSPSGRTMTKNQKKEHEIALNRDCVSWPTMPRFCRLRQEDY